MSAKESKILAGAVATDSGVQVNGILCLPVVVQCEGCDRIRTFATQNFCASYPMPEKKWSLGRCNFATHIHDESRAQAKINPLKASKRSAKGKK